MRRVFSVFFACVFLISGCASGGGKVHLSDWGKAGMKYMVAADHPTASLVGSKIMSQGGNVVDAAVATSFALAVARPYSAGLGGGGFMIVHRAGQEPVALDYRESAPRAATPENYLDASGEVISGKTVRGHWAVGVPGQVKGLEFALKQYGTMSLSAVLQPAIDMAWNGIRVDLHTHEAMVRLSDYLDEHPEDVPKFREIARIYLKDGKPYAVGDKLKQQDLAKSLRLLADGGSETFYKGVIAKRIIDDMQTQLGPMSAQDLAGYQIRVRKPLKGVYRGYEVIGMPPPSSGGACLMQALNVMEGYDPKTVAPADYYHALAESMKHAFADRASFLGDEDHHPEVAEDVRKMLSPAHAGKIREAILKDETRPAKDYGIHGLNDDSGTTHYSIVDSKGNAVAATETINLAFGSFVVPAGTGIVMNNELDDFAVKTGVANEFGLMMSERNRIKPGQRPLSSMSPTLLLKDGKAVLAAGASGGPKIITATLQAILQIVDFGKTPDAAVAAPRIHHQWSPNKIRYEEGIGPEIASALTARGHEMEAYSGSAAGVCQAVYVKDGHLYGASDPRKGGRPAGK